MTRTAKNPPRLLFLLLMLLATTTQWTTRAHASDPTTIRNVLVVDCQQRHITRRVASRLLGTDNSGQTFARRAQLHAEIARACTAGIAAVRLESNALGGSGRRNGVSTQGARHR